MPKLPSHPMQAETRQTLIVVLDTLKAIPSATVSAAFDSIPEDNHFKGAAMLYTLLASATLEWEQVGNLRGGLAQATVERAIRFGEPQEAI